MKDKLTKLLNSYKELGELNKEYIELYSNVSMIYDSIDVEKYDEYGYYYEKEDTIQEAIDFCLDNVSKTEIEWIKENNIDDEKFFMTLFAKTNDLDKEKMLKLRDYDNYGIIELSSLNQSIISKLEMIQDEENVLKEEIVTNPTVKVAKENANKIISVAKDIITPYEEVAKSQLEVAKGMATKKINEIKSDVDKKISNGAKILSKKLDDISNKHNK